MYLLFLFSSHRLLLLLLSLSSAFSSSSFYIFISCFSSSSSLYLLPTSLQAVHSSLLPLLNLLFHHAVFSTSSSFCLFISSFPPPCPYLLPIARNLSIFSPSFGPPLLPSALLCLYLDLYLYLPFTSFPSSSYLSFLISLFHSLLFTCPAY